MSEDSKTDLHSKSTRELKTMARELSVDIAGVIEKDELRKRVLDALTAKGESANSDARVASTDGKRKPSKAPKASTSASVVLGCAVCSSLVSKDGGNMKVCAKCRIIRYCSREHQVQDWKSHKSQCVKHRSKSSLGTHGKLTKLLNSTRAKIRRGDLDAAASEARKAHELASTAKDLDHSEKYKALSLRELSKCQGDKAALKTLKEALECAKRSADDAVLAVAYSWVALGYLRIGNLNAVSNALAKCKADTLKPEEFSTYQRTKVCCQLAHQNYSKARRLAEDFLNLARVESRWERCKPTALVLIANSHYLDGVATCAKPAKNMMEAGRQGLIAKDHFEHTIKFAMEGIAIIDKEPEYTDTYTMKDLLYYATQAYFQRQNKAKFTEMLARFRVFVKEKCVSPDPTEIQTLDQMECQMKMLSLFTNPKF